MWAPEERGGPVGWYGLGPIVRFSQSSGQILRSTCPYSSVSELIEQAGPIVGGMIGYWILPRGWRFLFWTITIMAGANTLLFILSAAETNAEYVSQTLPFPIIYTRRVI